MSNRSIYVLGFLVICVLLGAGFYVQYIDGIIPCPLCMLQRITFGLLCLCFLAGIFLHAKRIGRMLVDFFGIICSSLGIILASRQLWLQEFPPTDMKGCGMGLQYMLKVFPLKDVAQNIFTGSVECSERGWSLFGIDMAGWALIWFLLFLIVTGWLFVKEWKQ